MSKEVNYPEKFVILTPWMPTILEVVKRDLKNEHLRKDWQFMKRFFPGKVPNKVTLQDMVEAYSKALQDEKIGEQIGEFIATHWLLKYGDMYSFYEEYLKKIQPNFGEIEELEKEQATALMHASVNEFGAVKSYIFSILNSVVFPTETLRILEEQAQEEVNAQEEREKVQKQNLSLEAMLEAHKREIARLTDKYEKKLGGLQKKYIQDVEALKKQISQLHRKMSNVS